MVVELICEFIEKFCQSGVSLLLVDQMVPEALALAPRAHVMSKGELVLSGSPSELDQDEILKRCVGTPLNELGEV